MFPEPVPVKVGFTSTVNDVVLITPAESGTNDIAVVVGTRTYQRPFVTL
jgi:hypothetical protein